MTANFSVEAEQASIGACLLSDEGYDECASLLRADDFAMINHQLIYRAVSELREDGKGVDIVTVNGRLWQIDASHESSFEHADDSLAYIAGIADATPSAANARVYAEIVKSHSVSRQLKAAASDISELADQSLSSSDKTSQASAILEQIATESDDVKPKNIRQIMLESLNEIEARMSVCGGVSGLSTGFEHLDNLTQGLQKADLFILAGRPSHGKSTVAMNIAQHVSMSGPVLFFSVEMSAAAMGYRLISAAGDVPLDNVRAGIFSDRQKDRMNDAVIKLRDNSQLVIDDTASLSIDQLRARARIHARKHGCKLVVVDYLQLLSGVGENKTNEIGYISRGLKALAKDLDVPVLALSQLNRGLAQRADKRPEVSDLRGSGDIEQDADVIAFIHIEKKYNPETHLQDLGELIIAKQRQGETGTVYLKTDLKHSRFLTNHDPIPEAPKKKEEEKQPPRINRAMFQHEERVY